MKKLFIVIAAALALLLAACAPVTQPSASAAAAPSSLPSSAASGVPANLPDPQEWAPSLTLDAKDYPKIDGSTATLPLAIYMRSKITGEALETSTQRTVFSTTGPSYLALASHEADLLVVYEAPQEIKDQLKSQGAKLLSKSIGLDALVFLTNDGNPVEGLTHEQIIDIYTGKIKSWSEVGGEDKEIIPYQRISNSGSQALMLKLVMKGTPIMQAPTTLQPGDMGELIDDIASYKNTANALGYSVYYYVSNMYSVPGVKLLAVDGVKPGSDTIASQQYPYINAFYAVIREGEPADSPARKLFDWLTGTEGSRAVKDAGYVPYNN
jgi:phosphate transport system substrate-binding protein